MFTTDVVIKPGQKTLDFCGARFGIIELPGHTPGQIGIITPDDVLYVADALMGQVILDTAKLPTVDDHEADIKTKKMLRVLDHRKYVLAHKGVYDDIGELVDRNLDFLESRAEFMMSTLTDGMSFGEWLESFYAAAGMRTRDPLRCSIYERNFRSFSGYLADIGRLEIVRKNGTNHYIKK